MPRRRFSSVQQGGRRRTPNWGWAGIIPAAPTTVSASSAVLIGTFVLDNDGIDETFLRVVGGIQIASDQAVASESPIGAIGMCVVTDVAAALGITAVPDPVSEIADDVWFWYVPFALSLQFSDATGLQPNFGIWFPFDQKGKRVVHSGSTVAIVAANSSAVGVQVTPVFRILTMVRGT